MKKSGVLLHISSINGDFGCGTLGNDAVKFAKLLIECGFTSWQVLPLNIPHKDASPYSSVSTYLQNPLFIDPYTLVNHCYLTKEEVNRLKEEIPSYKGDYYKLAEHRDKYLRLASERAYKLHPERIWNFLNENPRIADACKFVIKSNENERELFHQAFIQYEFHNEWNTFRFCLSEIGIEIIGDIPIYADKNSSEVYYNKECFLLDENGDAEFVSGVPGDEFNDAGQKWGHPLYRTEALEAQNYRLLYDRMEFASKMYDVTRIDHFQALAQYYAIPANEEPRFGHWERGVGEPFIKMLSEKIGKDKIVVEDFGSFPGGAHDLAMKYGFSDMNTLQFTLSDGKTAESYKNNTVAYTGTHDNNTMLGYFHELSKESLCKVRNLLGAKRFTTKKRMVDLAVSSLLASEAERVIIPVQDLLREDGKSRMNLPGISGHGNWTYRITKKNFNYLKKRADYFKKLNTEYNRFDPNRRRRQNETDRECII